MYELGKWIRKRYATLSNHYRPGTVEILSETSDCILMSAECLLLGLFPANGSEFWKNASALTHTWQPIPVHTVQSTMDFVNFINKSLKTRYPIVKMKI